jgi:hypothetical protein
MLIYPDIQATPDCPTIKFSQPREQIDLNKELPRILHAQGWGCGTLFNVMFLNHEKTKLLACVRFVVSEEIETIQTNDANPYQPMTKTVFSRRAEQIGDWWPNVMQDSVTVDIVADGAQKEDVPDTLRQARFIADEIVKRGDLREEPKRRGRPPKADQVIV